MFDKYEDIFWLSDDDGGGAKIAPAPAYEDEKDYEIVFMDEHEMVEDDLPDDIKNKSKKDIYEEMKNQQQSNEVIVETLGKNFEDLGNKLKQPPAKVNPVTQVPQQPTGTKKSAAELKAEVNKKVWEGNFTDNIDPYLDARESKFNEKLIALERQNFNLAAQILSNDPTNKDILENRQEEVNQYLMTYSPEHRFNPQVLTEVVTKIKQSDYAKDPLSNPDIKALIDEKVANALKEKGVVVEDTSQGQANNAPYTAGGGVPNRSKTVKIKVPKWVKTQADQMGMDATHYYRIMKEQGKL